MDDPLRAVALHVGRVAVEKNIEAFLAAPWAGDKLVVGDGPARDRFQALAPDAIFTGFLDGTNLARAYASDEGLAEDLQAALNVLVIARDDDDPERVPNEDVPAAIYTNILIVAGHMPDLCPDVIVPDFSTYSNFAPE